MEKIKIEEGFEYYCFTLTFAHAKAALKFKRINRLPSIIQRILNIETEVFYSIEYHKKADRKSNNYTRPHIHGILKASRLSTAQHFDVETYFKFNWGITQFAIQEDLEEVTGWLQYISKDIEENDNHFNGLMKHGRSFKTSIVKDKVSLDLEDF